jgi:hypothetical protein
MAYSLPAWQDAPETVSPLDSVNLLAYNTAINDLDSRVAANVASVAAGDSTITIRGTATAPTVKVLQSALTIAESQVTGLASGLAAVNSSITTGLAAGYQAGGVWGTNVYGFTMQNLEIDDAGGTLLMVGASSRTMIVLLGLAPAATYSVFKLYVTNTPTAGSLTCALYSASSMSNTSWARLGSGNVTATIAAAPGMVTTSLAYTLASPAYVMLEMVATSTFTTYPSFASTVASTVPVGLMNPISGNAPVTGTANASSAPGTTLNPTTGFTASAQKVWCALD